MNRFEIGGVACDVAVLAGNHPERGVRELTGDGVPVVREGEPERLGEEGVAREEGDALTERDVRARPPAPLVVVVERGKVVVDERERVHQLERGRRGQSGFDRASGGFRDREAQHRPDPLPSCLERIAKHLVELAQLGGERERAEVRLDRLAQLVSLPHPPGPARA